MDTTVYAINNQRILVAASLSWPLSARLASRFIHYSCRVSVICPRGHVLRHVDGVASVHPYRPFDSLRSLEEAIDQSEPDIVIPCDDRVAAQLHELHERRPALRALIESSLGPARSHEIVRCREPLLATARALGILVPETRPVTSEGDVRAWFEGGAPAGVLKRDGTWGGAGVVVARSEDAAVRAYSQLARQPGAAFALKRLVINQDPLSWWSWKRRAPPAITIQQLVKGRPANAMLACWRGELVGIVTVEVLKAQGATGAALVVRVVENKQIERAAALLAERLGLTGFFGLDFMLEDETDACYLIEMNPRCTQLGHLSLGKQGDLAGVLFAKMSGRPRPESRASTARDVVAFFPQALTCGASGADLDGSHLDIPWESPRLVRELLRPPSPDRRWIARLYNWFRTPETVGTTDYPRRRRRRAATNTASPHIQARLPVGSFARSHWQPPILGRSGDTTSEL
jgi:ATP-grasp domain